MDDPNEKSLFSRIKDCVLTELRRSNNEVKRTHCSSRSIWGWNFDNNVVKEPEVQKEVPEKPMKPPPNVLRTQERESSQGGRLSGGHDDARSRSEEKSSYSVNLEDSKKNNAQNSEKVHVEGKYENNYSGRSEEGVSRSSPDRQESCDSKNSKPIRYYIKMQNPEAPPCCESLESRKSCPPKMKKSQRESMDSYDSIPTCQCGRCSTEPA